MSETKYDKILQKATEEIDDIFEQYSGWVFVYEPDEERDEYDGGPLSIDVKMAYNCFGSDWCTYIQLLCDLDGCEINIYDHVYETLNEANCFRMMFFSEADDNKAKAAQITRIEAELAAERDKTTSLERSLSDVHKDAERMDKELAECGRRYRSRKNGGIGYQERLEDD